MSIFTALLAVLVIGINLFFISVYIHSLPSHWAVYVAVSVLVILYLTFVLYLVSLCSSGFYKFILRWYGIPFNYIYKDVKETKFLSQLQHNNHQNKAFFGFAQRDKTRSSNWYQDLSLRPRPSLELAIIGGNCVL